MIVVNFVWLANTLQTKNVLVKILPVQEAFHSATTAELTMKACPLLSTVTSRSLTKERRAGRINLSEFTQFYCLDSFWVRCITCTWTRYYKSTVNCDKVYLISNLVNHHMVFSSICLQQMPPILLHTGTWRELWVI